MQSSIISYKKRGSFGNARWRGNTSGFLIIDLINQFNIKYFVDVCEGSGTSADVCKYLGIDYTGLDLHKGQDFTTDYILKNLKREADMVFSHPPYNDMIKYSGNVWGNSKVHNDLSHCNDVDEFLEKAYVMLLNQREATKKDGYYVTLIGDHKKNGVCYSYQSDFLKMMPRSELVNVVIKAQHNCFSNSTTYSKNNFIPIKHEYLLIWKRLEANLYKISWQQALESKKNISRTWRTVIRIALMKLGGNAKLSDIYNGVAFIASDLITKNKNWEAKIRQQLQLHFTNVSRGVWSI